jgi:hypothetical protein
MRPGYGAGEDFSMVVFIGELIAPEALEAVTVVLCVAENTEVPFCLRAAR